MSQDIDARKIFEANPDAICVKCDVPWKNHRLVRSKTSRTFLKFHCGCHDAKSSKDVECDKEVFRGCLVKLQEIQSILFYQPGFSETLMHVDRAANTIQKQINSK